MKCVFFGSPDFALGSLSALLASKHNVLGVITQPDRPAGRGLRLEPPAVKKLAQEHSLPILQPEKVNCEETYSFLENLKPDVLCVVAYGGFLGARLLGFCKTPPINVHPSLLPDLRGAAPMQWALLRGYKSSGVSTQFMVKEMDAGDVLLQTITDIDPNETAKELQDRLKVVGGDLLVHTLDQLEASTLRPTPQDSSKATFAPLLNKEDGHIRWDECDATTIHNQARALYPWPGAYTGQNHKRVKILKTRVLSEQPTGKTPGSFYEKDGALLVHCATGVLQVLELQPEGKRPLLPHDFLNGIKGHGPMQFEPLLTKETP